MRFIHINDSELIDIDAICAVKYSSTPETRQVPRAMDTPRHEKIGEDLQLIVTLQSGTSHPVMDQFAKDLWHELSVHIE